MRYFERLRLEWIADMLNVYGFINREHLIRKFGISEPQASHDFAVFQRQSPTAMHYERSTKRYVAGPAPQEIVI